MIGSPLQYDAPDVSYSHLPSIPDVDERDSGQDFWEAAAAAAIAKGIEIPTGLFPTPVYGVHYPVTKVGPTWKVLQKYTATSFDVTKYPLGPALPDFDSRSEEHTSELQSLMRISYAVFCLKKKKKQNNK